MNCTKDTFGAFTPRGRFLLAFERRAFVLSRVLWPPLFTLMRPGMRHLTKEKLVKVRVWKLLLLLPRVLLHAVGRGGDSGRKALHARVHVFDGGRWGDVGQTRNLLFQSPGNVDGEERVCLLGLQGICVASPLRSGKLS